MILKKIFIAFSLVFFYSGAFAAVDCHAYEGDVVPKIKLDHVLVLGVGSDFGGEYKIDVFRKLRPYIQNLYVCELSDNELIGRLLEEGLVDQFIPVKEIEEESTSREILNQLHKANVSLDAVVTYREEWLQTRTLIAMDYGLPHPLLEAHVRSQNKYTTREILQEASIESVRHERVDITNLSDAAMNFGFPFFLKPQKGIRSEWARRIDSPSALDGYIETIKDFVDISDATFVIEELIHGHEVDADIVLFKGELLYSEVSDNFPVYRPFALETGHLMPSLLDEHITRMIADHAFKATRALGYEDGVFHIELILQPDATVRVIEINGRVGGMYIPKWHEEVWGVDLITAGLAIAAGIDPTPVLQKKENPRAFAQICVTANQNRHSNLSGPVEILDWENFEDVAQNEEVYLAKKWIHFPCKKEISVNGHANIGEITVEAETPLLAFRKLLRVCETYTPRIKTSNGTIDETLTVLRRFCSNTPGVRRIGIRQATNQDRYALEQLLPYLTRRVKSSSFGKSRLPKIPDSTIVLLAEDTFSADRRVVGMVSLHIWNRMRPEHGKTCFVHDLVIHPDYRGLELGKALVREVLEVSQELNIDKVEIACEESLIKYYTPFGFVPVGAHLVKYLNAVSESSQPESNGKPFSQKEITRKGEWIYGQDIVSKLITPVDRKVKIPRHFFIPQTVNPRAMVDRIHAYGKPYSVKYSLNGNEAFSYGRKRGGNSSRGRKLDPRTLSKDELALRIQEFIQKSPPNCAGLVLQEFIDQTGGGLFHAELSSKGIQVELLWETSRGRAYSTASLRGRGLASFEEIAGPGEPVDRRSACEKMTQRFRRIYGRLRKSFGDVTWSIEGFWLPEKSEITVLQLRPTPQDRPISSIKNTDGYIYSTNFSWGDYEVGPIELTESEEISAQGVYIRSDAAIKESMEVELKDALLTGQFVLLVDPFKGFCLSHEKMFLPPPYLRKSYGFMYVPQEVIARVRGRKVILLSSGGRGYIVPYERVHRMVR